MTRATHSTITVMLAKRNAACEIPLLLLLTLLLALLPARMLAQAIFGSVNGVVTDSSGAAVPGASITMTDTDKGTTRVVVSTSSGEYLVHDLIPDHYKFKIEAPGFSTLESDVITVSADSSAQVNFQLKPGSGFADGGSHGGSSAVENRSCRCFHHAEYAYVRRNTEPDTKYHQPGVACPGYDRFHLFECQC